MRSMSPKNKMILNSKIALLRRTTWKCGYVERCILRFLIERRRPVEVKEIIEFFSKHGFTRGRIYNEMIKLFNKYGPTKGKLLYAILEAIARLEKRYIIKIIPSRK